MEMQRRKLWPFILLGVMLAIFFTTVSGKMKSVQYDPNVLTTFTQSGVTMELPEASAKKRNRDVALYYVWEEGLLIGGTNTKAQIEEAGYNPDMTEEEYAAICLSDANADAEVFVDDYGNVGFSYEVVGAENSLYYYVVVKKGEDNFWVFNYVCESELKDTYDDHFPLWASTIVVE